MNLNHSTKSTEHANCMALLLLSAVLVCWRHQFSTLEHSRVEEIVNCHICLRDMTEKVCHILCGSILLHYCTFTLYIVYLQIGTSKFFSEHLHLQVTVHLQIGI